jgi:hypothetical protein
MNAFSFLNLNHYSFYLSSLYLRPEGINDHADLITEAADSLMNLEHYSSALKYYLMLEGGAEVDHVSEMMPDIRTI